MMCSISGKADLKLISRKYDPAKAVFVGKGNEHLTTRLGGNHLILYALQTLDGKRKETVFFSTSLMSSGE